MGLFGSLLKGIVNGGNIYAVAQNAVTAECILMDMDINGRSDLFRVIIATTIKATGGRMKPERVVIFFNGKNRLEQLCMIAVALDESNMIPRSYPQLNVVENPFLYTHKITDTEINMATANMERVTGRYVEIRLSPLNWMSDFAPNNACTEDELNRRLVDGDLLFEEYEGHLVDLKARS